ncbi:DegV family protein [Tissierella carlieri]|uniref:DegV family protein n=1 Tax=Tissierella carlieri TaxID=689904 RepID=A0ABT1SEF5_9FIRM|nr:DegV family protein [Tissierella carlieri]MBU5313706.1 DegV family protein [Tissierella carlieri]MCQ4924347.1 DegV family protein [Tissierella carlieri]
MKKIILSADSTCDLNHELIGHHNVNSFPYTILLDENTYKDNVDITPAEIFRVYSEKKILPKTSAINVAEYYSYFKPWIDDGYEIIHVNLGSALTSSYNNCCIVANELKGIYPIDSHNLSTGSALLVLKAANMIKEGLSAKEISDRLNSHRENIHMSFVLDTLDFLHAGGRCSRTSSLGANLLKIKPVINVDNKSGAMDLGNKYRGTLNKVIVKYINDKLSSYDNINKENIFIVHSGIDSEYIELAKNTILEHTDFKKIHVTIASCTISCHCGPNTLGIAFETK